MDNNNSFIPYHHPEISQTEMLKRIQDFNAEMQKRRSLRMFSDRAVDRKIIEEIISVAGSAPSGAHKQPWSFCAVSNREIKSKIREAAEKEEYENYHGRMSDEWMKDLEVFDTDWNKSFLETAPWLIIIFKKAYDLNTSEEKSKNYYVNESVGIATGFLLTAIHQAGLVSLTHTPSPMNFLHAILDRPDNERAYLLIPVGYAAENAQVPDLKRKPLHEISKFY